VVREGLQDWELLSRAADKVHFAIDCARLLRQNLVQNPSIADCAAMHRPHPASLTNTPSSAHITVLEVPAEYLKGFLGLSPQELGLINAVWKSGDDLSPEDENEWAEAAMVVAKVLGPLAVDLEADHGALFGTLGAKTGKKRIPASDPKAKAEAEKRLSSVFSGPGALDATYAT